MNVRRVTPALLAIGIAVLAALPWLSPAPRVVRRTLVPAALPSGTGGEARPRPAAFGRDPRDLLLYDRQGPTPDELRMRDFGNRLHVNDPR